MITPATLSNEHPTREITEQDKNLNSLNSALSLQKGAFRGDANPSLAERINRLKTLHRCVHRYKSQIADAIQKDFGNRSESETLLAEISPLLENIQYHIKQLPKWMAISKRTPPIFLAPAKAYVSYQPLGVIGIISPWNYPAYLSIGPLITALAAGNRAMIKVSELTPETGSILKSILEEAYPDDLVQVFTGGPDVAQAFSKLAFDHMIFTGSTSIGKKVMAAAAENLTPTTLELGGKSPVIIGGDADIKQAAKSIAFGKCFNAGQTCVAPDYVLCPEDQLDTFIKSFTAQVNQMYPSVTEGDDFTSIINERQYQRLLAIKKDAISKGAEVTETQKSSDDPECHNKRKIAPTLFTNINDNMVIAQDEIFGPLMGIIPYKKLDDAIHYVNDRPRPLALYYFGHKQDDIDCITDQTHSGGIAINDTLAHVAVDDMPFGGIGPSGMGHYHGKEGFLTFSHAKGILKKGRFNSTQLVYPPWNKLVQKLLFKYLIKPPRP